MQRALQVILNGRTRLFPGLFSGALMLPGTAWATGLNQSTPRIQPALILALALALTSLVLFCIYIYQQRKAKKINRSNQQSWSTGDDPLQTRLYETHKALNTLFSKPGIPMAKIALEQGKIMDATPSLYQALGYSKKKFLKKRPDKLGLLPTRKDDIRHLIQNGWTESRTRLRHNRTGARMNCHILNIATHLDGYPTVLSIFPDLDDICPANHVPDPIRQDMLTH